MRSLTGSNAICKELQNILTAPVKVVTEYDTLPELQSVISFPELGRSTSPQLYAYRLGRKKIEKISYKRLISHAGTPELRIYTFTDIIVYNGFMFTLRGELLADSIRFFSEDFSARTATVPQIFTDKYTLFTPSKDTSYINQYDRQATVFCSYAQYGHYLLEYVTNLWIADFGYHPCLLLSPQSGKSLLKGITEVPHYLLDMVRPFSYTNNDFIISPMGLFQQMLLVKRSYMQTLYFHEAAKMVFNKISEFYYQTSSNYPQKIYISRKKTRLRKLLNEEECERLFVQYGFTPICPESLPFTEQVNLFARATHIAGPVGTGLHNIVFSRIPHSVKLLMLAPVADRNNLFSVADGRSAPPVAIERAYNREPYVIYGEYIRAKQNTTVTLDSSWTIPMKEVATGVQQWLDL
jgi:capsular polysaccharide biosynthesis protein